MPFDACPRCDLMFEKTATALVCPRCREAEEKDYDKIRDVLDQAPELNAEQVAEQADVDINCVLRMIDEGLISSISLGEKTRCGMCGAPAISSSKKLCQACLQKLNAQVARQQSRVILEGRKQVQVGGYDMAGVRKTLDDKRKG